MSDLPTLLLFVAIAVALTVILLGLGAWVGFRAGLNARLMPVIAPPASAKLLEEVQAYRELAKVMDQRSGAVLEIATPHADLLPPHFRRALEELFEATRQLSSQLAIVGAPVPSGLPRPTPSTSTDLRPSTSHPRTSNERAKVVTNSDNHPRLPTSDLGPPTPDLRPSAADIRPSTSDLPLSAADLRPAVTELRPSSGLTGAEMQSIAQLAGNPLSHPPEGTNRYPYDCFQTIYPRYDDGADPLETQGIKVRCRDLSPQGIAFLLPGNPDFERLMITLGSDPNRILMNAEVRHSRSVFMHGQVCVLVGCQFTGRASIELPRPTPADSAMPPGADPLHLIAS